MKKQQEKPDFIHIQKGDNPITVVGIVEQRSGVNVLSIGASRCGDDNEYDKDLGIEIATHRCHIQPWCRIELDGMEGKQKKTKAKISGFVFGIIAASVIDHIDRSTGWATGIKRERNNIASIPDVTPGVRPASA